MTTILGLHEMQRCVLFPAFRRSSTLLTYRVVYQIVRKYSRYRNNLLIIKWMQFAEESSRWSSWKSRITYILFCVLHPLYYQQIVSISRILPHNLVNHPICQQSRGST